MSTVGAAPSLMEEIIARIKGRGKITFAEFMDAALYLPGKGYYASGRTVWGEGGDYITNAHLNPVFGGALAGVLNSMWTSCGAPAGFKVIEAGAGSGALMDAVISAVKTRYPRFFKSASFYIIEKNETAGKLLEGRALRLASIEDIGAPFTGCIYSNELLDAMPFHRVVRRDGGLREIYAGYEDGRGFFDVEDEASTPLISEYFNELGIEPPVNRPVEAGLLAKEWTGRAASLIERGFVLTIDYGHPAKTLYSPERASTLMCHYKHTLNDDPYKNIGEQDITCHVDFTSVKNAGEAAGLSTIGFSSQREFLMGAGVLDELVDLTGDARPGIEAIRINQAVKELIMPGGIGDTMKVFVQGRGVDAASCAGFFSMRNERGKL